jgi:hypothetical protein
LCNHSYRVSKMDLLCLVSGIFPSYLWWKFTFSKGSSGLDLTKKIWKIHLIIKGTLVKFKKKIRNQYFQHNIKEKKPDTKHNKSILDTLYEWLHNYLPQWPKSTFHEFFWKKISSLCRPLWTSFVQRRLKNVDFGLWVKQPTVKRHDALPLPVKKRFEKKIIKCNFQFEIVIFYICEQKKKNSWSPTQSSLNWWINT